MSPHASYGRALERLGFLRYVPALETGGSYREWLHFAIHAPLVDVLVNFSIVRSDRGTFGNVLLLVREPGGAWDGDMDAFSESELDVGSGRLRMRMGASALELDGVLRVVAACRRRRVAVNLALVPESFPCLVQNVGLAGDAPISWLLAPRLAAFGSVAWDGRRVSLEGASAYHDHNWGNFAGGDLAWEWSCTLATATSPWNVVTVRMMDGAGARTLSQGVLSWEHGSRRTGFRSSQVSFAREGMRWPESSLRVPRPLALLAPTTAGVPERLQVAASSGRDWLAGSIETMDHARVIVPRDTATGLMVLREVAARSAFTGRMGGREVRIEGPAFLELAGPLA